jgi:hypothetical protein
MSLRLLLILIGGISAGLVSCGDEQISGPTEGTILVAAITSGDDMDPNGYTFSVNNSSPDPIGLLDTVYVPDLEAGNYEVRLTGIADNCAPAENTNPQTVAVIAGDTVSARFDITCDLIGTPGE